MIRLVNTVVCKEKGELNWEAFQKKILKDRTIGSPHINNWSWCNALKGNQGNPPDASVFLYTMKLIDVIFSLLLGNFFFGTLIPGEFPLFNAGHS